MSPSEASPSVMIINDAFLPVILQVVIVDKWWIGGSQVTRVNAQCELMARHPGVISPRHPRR
jgi:hypothetical protein